VVFRHNKIVRTARGFKLHLYLPAYPTPAFFQAIETKLVRTPPGPITVVFSMTKACTYKCQHCYQRLDGGADLAEETMLRTARAVQERGVAMFDIEGGEPLLRPARLLRLLNAIDRRSEIWVNTVGARADAATLERLKEAGLAGIMVSVHSPDEDRHDAFTGVPGSFRAACNALAEAHRIGLMAAVNSVLAEEEIVTGGLDRLMDLARDLDCDFVQLIHPKPAGKWLGRREAMQGDAGILAAVRGKHLHYNGRGTPDHPSLAAQVFEESARVFGCTAGGVDRFYVNAFGEVQPCEFLNISFGNVREESFDAIFDRMRGFFPTPCLDWLCCTQAGAIHDLVRAGGAERTPVPWDLTRSLADQWERGRPTPLYRRLGVYR
jgi:MoaA/NifB/PqqE/SkfB family radical SAM enzyme